MQQAEVARYLVDGGLLDAAAVVDANVVVRDASSRNRNFVVRRDGGPGLVLKQGLGPLAVATVAHEARVYRTLHAAGGALAAALAPLRGYDERRGVLALGLVEGRDLRAQHVESAAFDPGLGAALGRALGALHRQTALPDSTPAPQHAPWVLSLHRPDLSVFRDTSAAGIEVIKIVQRAAGFAEQLDALRDGWQLAALVHHDVKWDNCIVAAPESAHDLRLVDWESAAYGDPCWDVGSALSQYLSFWLFSIPITGTTPPAQFPRLARYPLESMQPALRACWHAYAAELATGEADVGERLERTVRHAAARLVQSAFEAALVSDQLTSGLVLHLQLALNMLQRPGDAAVHLLGLRAPRADT